MAIANGKHHAGDLDGTPNKRLYWSIINDYDTVTALCELIDNALDIWTINGQKGKLAIDLKIDKARQLITVIDTAGGVKQSNLKNLITPGGSTNDPDANTIGVFGVGSKRAVVALAETVVIKTRYKAEATYQIDISKDWLESQDWELPYYSTTAIPAASTEITLSALRRPISALDLDEVGLHFSETYGRFLKSKNLLLTLNGLQLKPTTFEHWSYPPKYPPRHTKLNLTIPHLGKLSAEIFAGLIRDRDPEGANYGVYFYCNQRLIAKEIKAREVGYFISSEAGVPHPDISLCRTIVRLNGPAKAMPWNSSKTDINYAHPVFAALRPTIVPLTSYYSKLSRRLKNDWDTDVFRFNRGNLEEVDASEPESNKWLVLPSLPKVNRSVIEHLLDKNKAQIRKSPWTLGLVEAMAATEIVSRQKLHTKNRINLILLDSNFEIALKEFIIHEESLFPKSQFNDQALKKLFANRNNVLSEVRSKIKIEQDLIDRANHYYQLRNKFIHERTTVDVTDNDIDNYREVVNEVLTLLFKLKN